MKLPKTIKIGPYDYKIVHKKIREGEACVGDFCSTRSRIRVTTGMNDIRTVETLLHEVLHAVYYSFNIGHGLDEAAEENIISLVSTGLAATLRDNPEFAEVLYTVLKEKSRA